MSQCGPLYAIKICGTTDLAQAEKWNTMTQSLSLRLSRCSQTPDTNSQNNSIDSNRGPNNKNLQAKEQINAPLAVSAFPVNMNISKL